MSAGRRVPSSEWAGCYGDFYAAVEILVANTA